MKARPRFTALGLGLALVLGAAPARAGLIATVTGTATAAAGGLTMYSYTVTDSIASTDNLGEVDLAVPVDANLTSFGMPIGFINLYTAGDIDLSFQSTSSPTDLTPGQSATFSFLSRDKPVQTTYVVSDFNTGDTAMGMVLGPAAVPEPGSLVLLGVGLSFAGAMAARRSRKRAG